MQASTYKDFYNKAAKYCAKAERNPQQVSLKLKQWNCQQDFIPTIIEQLQQENFINTTRYCQAYTNDKIKFNHWGRRKIETALNYAKLPQEDIQQALNNINPELYKQALNYVLTHHRPNPRYTPLEQTHALIQHAQAAGFETQLILQQINDETVDSYISQE